jgi:hypothetical protein
VELLTKRMPTRLPVSSHSTLLLTTRNNINKREKGRGSVGRAMYGKVIPGPMTKAGPSCQHVVTYNILKDSSPSIAGLGFVM